MVEYKCLMCKKLVPRNLVERRIRCHFCGSRTLQKIRGQNLSPIKAR